MLEKIGKNLSTLMGKMRVTANELAIATGIPVSTLKKIRTQAQVNPTLSTLIPIAKFFSVSLDQLALGDVLEPNKETIRLLSVISWSDVAFGKSFYQSGSHFISSENDFSAEAFALRMDVDDFSLFPLHSILLIDLQKQPMHRDYVLVSKPGQSKIFLKQYILEDDSAWLRSVNINENITALTAEYAVLGIIVESRMQLSSNNTTKNKLKVRETIL